MAKKDLIQAIEETATEETKIDANDIDSPPECEFCGQQMPFDKYNKQSPQDDFISHIVPGAGEYTPPKEVLYCGVSCFMNEMKKFE